ncbi:GATA-like domain-containing protein [Aspergillus fischeri NRRL 181]|uniref:Nitrogen regulatory protein areA GATA-like domain-containing protein n=1 Tax=Neosartorya fischeri (strain ATCC 1020 / DSM 3700 / CBS 544.65 / FGSC A1164 / JCM 1740 / NRRL 181 / WB 181) TaxID=331117 RepID=A1DEU6_NEOFI|nr:conserved hypothetical protein [Aspergillus fischeri NRRL 181]EAW17903.1 conserved hypothetical protein [Aspergillus fischeri NRRL 181]KAG2018940.1 hypothetical protein GB937_005578 [Aspergillus fischeri]
MDELPEGLLSTTKTPPSSFDDSMPVHVQDITLLWKAYNVKPSALEGIIGHRLANFFWRIWSNECLRISLPSATVAKLFMRISESTASKVSEVPSNTNPSLRKNKSEGKLPERLNNQAAHTGPLQSILKKPNAVPKETHKTTRWLITDDNDNNSTCEAVNSASPATAITSATGVSTCRHSHRKTQFVASKTARGSKRRPVILRRKSSQSTSGVKSTRTQSPQRGVSTQRADKTEEYVEPEVHLPEREVTRSPSPELKEAIPLPKHIEKLMPAEQPELPPSFLANLKLLLKLRPRTATYKTAPLTMGFRSQIPNKFRDIRYLYIEYYRPPPRAIVHAEFRAVFLKRMWEEQLFLASFFEKMELQQQQHESFGSEGTSLSTTFESSTFSNSNGNASTAPTSVDVSMTSEYNVNVAESKGSFLSSAREIPRSFFHHTPSPLKRMESLLGMEIEERRRNGTLVYEEIDPEEENLGPVKLPRCYYDTLSEWDYHD